MVEAHNQEIAEWLAEHREEIARGEIQVLAIDECHVQGGDICGYGWGNRQERREVPVENYRSSQTYYGALDCLNHHCIVKSYPRANSHNTIDFIEFVRNQCPSSKLAILWDGASYHRSEEFRAYLQRVNTQEQWHIHCLRFAPYAPQENPIENLWGQAKHLLKQLCHRCTTFAMTKRLFEMIFDYRLFTMPNLTSYGAFSNLI